MESKLTKKKLMIVGIGVISLIAIILFTFTAGGNLHKEEIHKVITQHGGVVTDIEKPSRSSSPFEEYGSGNTIYKITYTKDNKTYIAWYRGVNNLSNIHERIKGSYEEAWIFYE
ncbi:hypothetical protein [Brevibacillus dissolubilis]|uniref:hypothetical protein n=1 Tax=Brevibacillus dissolubilis TaxID=1844116 RepID=UPI0011162E2E|nr:hypothetical protein [Brevibacillus dissolubilis]